MSTSLGGVHLSKLQTQHGFYNITCNSVTDFSWTLPVFPRVSFLCSRIQLRACSGVGRGSGDRLFSGPSKVLQLGLSEMTDDLEEIRRRDQGASPLHRGAELEVSLEHL